MSRLEEIIAVVKSQTEAVRKLSHNDLNWLIEQAEKAEELEKENERYEKSINDALKELHLSNVCGNESVKAACNILKGESK